MAFISMMQMSPSPFKSWHEARIGQFASVFEYISVPVELLAWHYTMSHAAARSHAGILGTLASWGEVTVQQTHVSNRCTKDVFTDTSQKMATKGQSWDTIQRCTKN
ncbi:hypothetical protein KIL84_018916 [Mauremys mutica]|uniref:Uncharacterized protein n=1 Tax=Mauremys mutica TaxID=74926 RepID=A0A9D3XUL4_9SAUR|nr:hypothetical protein KIL84_018916 [Mauremys mutica]